MASAAQRQLNQQLARGGPEEICALVREHSGVMNSVNCATALHRLAKGAPVAAAAGVEALLCSRTARVLGTEKVTPRSLTSIAWAVGKLRLSHAALLGALTSTAAAQLASGALDAFGIANVAWALATQHAAAAAAAVESVALSAEHTGLLEALADAACRSPGAFKPQELTNLLWAFATLKRRHSRLFETFSPAVTDRASEFTPQGLSQTLWSYSKLGLCKHALLLAAAAAALPRFPSFDPQSVATLAWSFANLEVEHRPLLAAACSHACARHAEYDSASASQLLWALSRLTDGVSPAALRAMAHRLAEAARGGLPAQQLLYALGALAKLPASVAPRLPSLLCRMAADAAPNLTCNKLGIAAWALARPSVHAAIGAAERRAWRDALRVRVLAAPEHLSWRSVGHIEIALRLLLEPPASWDETDPVAAALTRAGSASLGAANARSVERNAAPLALLLRTAPWAALPRGSRVLLVGIETADDDAEAPAAAIDASLRAAGLVAVHWRRFACAAQDASAAPWPAAPPGGGLFGACVMRWPWYAAGDAAAMALHASASVTAAGAPLWLCGNTDEGADGAAEAIDAAYGRASQVASDGGGALLLSARRGDAGAAAARGARGALEGWLTRSSLTLPRVGESAGGEGGDAALDWVTYPGLFAGGGVDVMTSALLAALPPPPAGSRVLDACCGSGVIAAALRHAVGGDGLKLYLLDADAVAVAAARANVPSAREVALSAGWPAAPAPGEADAFHKRGGRPTRFDWIVTNPPVHRGQPDDFRVVADLISGGASRLRRGGVLWIVAQEQVPVGRMLELHGGFGKVDAAVSADGRFVVWSASECRRAEGEEGVGAPPAEAEAGARAEKKAAKKAKKAAKKAAEEAAVSAGTPAPAAPAASAASAAPAPLVFSGLTFALTVGGSELGRRSLEELIVSRGGVISNTVHRRVSYVVASDRAVRRNTQAVRKARLKFGIPLVTPEFVSSSARAGAIANPDDYVPAEPAPKRAKGKQAAAPPELPADPSPPLASSGSEPQPTTRTGKRKRKHD